MSNPAAQPRYQPRSLEIAGKSCIRGLRIIGYDVLDYLASGMSEAEILAGFPDLTHDGSHVSWR